MYNGYLIPANTKKSILIFGMLRPIDAFILGGGILISVGLLFIFSDAGTLLLLVSCIPMILALILVLPIPNYHNTLVVIQSVLRYYNERRNYIWKGWCVYDEFKDSK
ncbi:MAG: hypothetical protein IJE89_05925 [Bacilli bacterium]|nr:hypothetical protein [Bacilli bacterium]